MSEKNNKIGGLRDSTSGQVICIWSYMYLTWVGSMTSYMVPQTPLGVTPESGEILSPAGNDKKRTKIQTK